MPFGAEDVQPAERDDLIVLGVALLAEVREDALPVRARHPIERVDVEEIDELVIVYEARLLFGQAFRDFFGQRLLARHVLRVAAEQDVGAAARHVRRDGDCALAAGLRDDLGFLRVVLGVQHHVLDAAPLQHRRQAL